MRRKGHKLSGDRISGLPDDAICHILSFLPTNLSVQTSILAKRWRLLWAQVPNLNFDVEDLDDSRRRSFNKFVNTVMSRHTAQTIHTFSLIFDGDSNEFEFEKCIATVVARNVRNLEICQYFNIKSPQCIFTCKTLVDLSLNGCVDTVRTGTTVYLPALRKLYLGYVWSTDEEYLPCLLSGCPVLEQLTIERDNCVNVLVCSPTVTKLVLFSMLPEDFEVRKSYGLKINTPAITLLKLHDFMSESFSTGPLTFLTKADVGFDGTLEVYDLERLVLYSRNVFEFIGKLCNVKRLKLSIGKMVVCDDSTLSALSMKFPNLTKLELAGDCRLISCFLENADNIEDLKIQMVNGDQENWIEPHQVPTSLSSRLRTVTILEFCREDDELELIAYLLENAKVLTWMKINSMHKLGVNIRFDALKTISMFQRGSDACVEFH